MYRSQIGLKVKIRQSGSVLEHIRKPTEVGDRRHRSYCAK